MASIIVPASSILCSDNFSTNKTSSRHGSTHQVRPSMQPSSVIGKEVSVRSSTSKFWNPLVRNCSRRSRGSSFRCSAVDSPVLPSALLFDCDGVLVDTEKDGHRVSFNDTFAEVCMILSHNYITRIHFDFWG